MPLRIPDINLHEEVDKLVSQIPEGMVTTYGNVATALGDIVASRFVGKVMSENDDIARVPCRRVVQSNGSLGGYTGGGMPAKRKALRAEGVRVDGDKLVDFEKILFTDFKTKFPLREFRDIQINDSKNLAIEDDFSGTSSVAGTDIAYDGDTAYGSLVLFDDADMTPKRIINVKADVVFPYIPTYLTFREAPVIEKLYKSLGDSAILVHDGNGIIHPLGFGVASHVGVMLDVPTIGVAKKLLCGKVKGDGLTKRVMIGRRHVGYAVSGNELGPPVYVSPGHRISVGSTLKLLKPYWKFRFPEPVRIAHIEAGKFRSAETSADRTKKLTNDASPGIRKVNMQTSML